MAQSWRTYIEPDIGLQENIICPHRFLLRLHGSVLSSVISPFKSLLNCPFCVKPGKSPYRFWAPLWIMGTMFLLPDHPGTQWSYQLSVAFPCHDPPHSKPSSLALLLFLQCADSLDSPKSLRGLATSPGLFSENTMSDPCLWSPLIYLLSSYLFFLYLSPAWRNFF